MFIEIKNNNANDIHYINIFKIMSIKDANMVLSMVDFDRKTTAIEYSNNGSTCIIFSEEPVKDFMKRLRRETKEATEGIEDRFEIIDL